MEHLVERELAGETEVLEENLSHCHSVHHITEIPERVVLLPQSSERTRKPAWLTTRERFIPDIILSFCLIIV
jgi:hypothetical protein